MYDDDDDGEDEDDDGGRSMRIVLLRFKIEK